MDLREQHRTARQWFLFWSQKGPEKYHGECRANQAFEYWKNELDRLNTLLSVYHF